LGDADVLSFDTEAHFGLNHGNVSVRCVSDSELGGADVEVVPARLQTSPVGGQ
jgi:hypothetical protein